MLVALLFCACFACINSGIVPAVITTITPNTIKTCGGEDIVLEGDHFVQAGAQTYCISGNSHTWVGLAVVSQTNNRLVCKAPVLPLGPAPIGVVIDNSSTRLFSNFVSAKARGDCLLGVSPTTSCIVGSTQVKVTTTGNYGYFKWILFTSQSNPALKQAVNAPVVPHGNNNTFLASTPTWLTPEDAMVSITTGPGGTAVSNQIPIRYTTNCLTTITPSSFCVLGGVTAFLHGQYLPVAPLNSYQQIDMQQLSANQTLLRTVRFGLGTDTMVNFTTPIYGSNFGVTAGIRLVGYTGMSTPATNIAPVTYFASCVTRIEPTHVSSAGGDTITLYGSQFPQAQFNLNGLICNFNDPGTNVTIQTKATWVSETVMTCVTPVVSASGKGMVTLSWWYGTEPSTTPLFIIYDNSKRKREVS